MITAGIDMGAKTIKVVILKDNQVLAESIVVGGREKEQFAQEAFDEAIKKAGISRDDIQHITATGVGRKRVPFADDDVTAVSADIKGTTFLLPSVRTVIDVGAEEGRAIRCDAGGKLIDFAVNEKCAAGAGTFVETLARTMEIKLEEAGELSLKSTQSIEMNAQCAVFGESEMVSLVHHKIPKVDIIHAVHDAIASRIGSLVRTIEVEKDIALIGGVAKNIGFIDSLKRNLGLDVLVPEDPEFVSALGAALIAARGVPVGEPEIEGKVVARED
jgi:benzoyl-CoA reductase subunit D